MSSLKYVIGIQILLCTRNNYVDSIAVVQNIENQKLVGSHAAVSMRTVGFSLRPLSKNACVQIGVTIFANHPRMNIEYLRFLEF